MKKLLIISYSFPPYGGGAVISLLKHVKYLPKAGWNPIILTTDAKNCKVHDPSLLEEIDPNTRIYRTRTLEPQGLKKSIGGKLSRRNKSWIKNKFWDSVVNIGRFLEHWLCVPDASILWLPFALNRAVKIIREDEIDVVYTTSPPNAVHLIGLALKKFYGKPWVADFRDDWSTNPFYDEKSSFRLRRFFDSRVNKFLEGLVINSADRVVSCSHRSMEWFVRRYPTEERLKFTAIYNGFDKDDFKDVKIAEDNRFTISYIGSLWYKRDYTNPIYFLKAVKKSIEKHPELKKDIIVKFIGSHIGVNKLIHEHEQDIVELIDHMPHKKAVEQMVNSDVLLLITFERLGGDKIATGKIYEYLAARRFILGLVPDECIAADLIRNSGAGVVIPPRDVDAISDKIYELYQNWKSGGLRPSLRIPIDEFDGKILAKKLADTMDAVT